jgi:predicted MFS family arabinose efflux permease
MAAERPAGYSIELCRGWTILLGATITMISGVATLPAYTAGLFITSLQSEFGWSRAAISLGPSIAALGIAVSTPFVGALTERFHPRMLAVAGIIGMAAAFLALSRMSGGIGMFYVVHLLFAIVGNLAGAAAVTPLLAASFNRARGVAIGVTMAGVGLGGGVASPIIAFIIHDHGWRAGYAAMSGFCLAMAFMVWALLRSSARFVFSARAASDRPSIRALLTQRTFVLLSVTFLFVSLGTTGLLLHFVPLLTDQGVDAREAAVIASLIGICIVLSRITVGFLTDRFFAPRVAAVIMIMGAFGFLIFAIGGAGFAAFGAIAIGLTFGAEVNLVGYLVGAYFDPRSYGRLFGILYAISLAGSMFSAFLYGAVRDAVGSYTPMILSAVALSTIAAALFLLLPKFPASDHRLVEELK